LGGNRVTKQKLIRNILIVFLLSGLWHGASWNFVIWGAINGLFILAFDRLLSNKNNKLFKRVLISAFVSLMWALSLIFFRAQTLGDALAMFSNLFEANNDILYNFGLNALEFSFTIKLLVAYMIFEIIIEKYNSLYQWLMNRNFFIRWTVYLSLLVIILLFGSYGVGLNDNNFIYFQF
jgi:D-alanyl-lipoteichoic acid acyltransferase DltB (MBOAT superfamily)